jgi:hypothetical protein
MRRMTPFLLAILLAALGSPATVNAQTGCARDSLNGIMDKYIASLVGHNASGLPLASTVKFTENSIQKQVGKGFWETSGKPLLKRTLIDTRKCSMHLHAVMEEKFIAKNLGGVSMAGALGAKPKPNPAEGTSRPVLFAARLRIENKKITEIETIIARETEFAFNAEGVLATKDQDWEAILPENQRTSRKAMIEAANNYFDMFAAEPKVSVPFAKNCDRWENGTQTTVGGQFGIGPWLPPHDCSPKGFVYNHPPQRFLVDTEKGLVVAYILFGGDLPDCHLFRMRNGKVDLILAFVGAESRSMGWPNEPAY